MKTVERVVPEAPRFLGFCVLCGQPFPKAARRAVSRQVMRLALHEAGWRELYGWHCGKPACRAKYEWHLRHPVMPGRTEWLG